ncbi:MAG: LON peptidase substrate-binding domain-containing protein, partial [Burkholderiales bacterium]|nr:LON peptidase substrate-binding domain-containing protein [Burkholderiales bacterium]
MPAAERDEAAGSGGDETLALFPLRTVLFPGGLLTLRVFEARYLDLVARCMRSGEGFGVVCLTEGPEAGAGGPVRFEAVGVRARIETVDAEQAGILALRCSGHDRFELSAAASQGADGLWQARVKSLPPDPPSMPAPAMFGTVKALSSAIAALRERDQLPFAEPFRLDDAGWVANRW